MFWCNNYLKISCKKFKYIQDLYWICRYRQCFAPQCNGRSSSMGARFCKQPTVQSCLSPTSLTHTSKSMGGSTYNTNTCTCIITICVMGVTTVTPVASWTGIFVISRGSACNHNTCTCIITVCDVSNTTVTPVASCIGIFVISGG